jgi:hypothetical protein
MGRWSYRAAKRVKRSKTIAISTIAIAAPVVAREGSMTAAMAKNNDVM